MSWTGIPVFQAHQAETTSCCGWKSCTSGSSGEGRRQGRFQNHPAYPGRAERLSARRARSRRPSVSGKTELSKALASFLFSDDDALIQIDMVNSTSSPRRVSARRPDTSATGGRPTHREGAAQAVASMVLFAPRSRRCIRRSTMPAAGARGWPAHRQAGPHGGLKKEHRAEPHVQSGRLRHLSRSV